MASPKMWIPNDVDGSPIWRHVRALNAKEWFDGRLLAPKVSKNDKNKLRWDVRGLLSLEDAFEKHGDRVRKEVGHLQSMLHKMKAEAEKTHSPIRSSAKAFALPRLDVPREARNYFYDPASHKIVVANWGAKRPPADYANERDDEPMSVMAESMIDVDLLGATQDAGSTAAEPAAKGPTKEQEEKLDALMAELDEHGSDLRMGMEALELFMAQDLPTKQG